jgi:hypothetical protein
LEVLPYCVDDVVAHSVNLPLYVAARAHAVDRGERTHYYIDRQSLRACLAGSTMPQRPSTSPLSSTIEPVEVDDRANGFTGRSYSEMNLTPA